MARHAHAAFDGEPLECGHSFVLAPHDASDDAPFFRHCRLSRPSLYPTVVNNFLPAVSSFADNYPGTGGEEGHRAGEGRGHKRKKWQHSWRNVLTRHGMFEWMCIVADRMLRLDSAGRTDLLARLAEQHNARRPFASPPANCPAEPPPLPHCGPFWGGKTRQTAHFGAFGAPLFLDPEKYRSFGNAIAAPEPLQNSDPEKTNTQSDSSIWYRQPTATIPATVILTSTRSMWA